MPSQVYSYGIKGSTCANGQMTKDTGRNLRHFCNKLQLMQQTHFFIIIIWPLWTIPWLNRQIYLARLELVYIYLFFNYYYLLFLFTQHTAKLFSAGLLREQKYYHSVHKLLIIWFCLLLTIFESTDKDYNLMTNHWNVETQTKMRLTDILCISTTENLCSLHSKTCFRLCFLTQFLHCWWKKLTKNKQTKKTS